MDARVRELLRVGRCGPVSRSLGRGAARVPVPGSELVAFGLLGKPRHGPVEVEVERDGSRWALDLRDDAHRLMFLDLYERDLRRRALALVPAGGVVVDVGANVGFWTIPAARALGPGGRVIAFEPNPWAVGRLRRNLALNDDGTLAAVEIVAAAVGEAPGTMELFSDDLEAGASQATLYAAAHDGSPQHVEVPVTTLDDVVTGPVDLVKIDVQGHEMAVLDGGRLLFEGTPPAHVAIEVAGDLLENAGATPELLVARLEGLGYRAVDGDGRLGREPVERPLPVGFYETIIFAAGS